MGILTIATAATITAVDSNEHAFGRDRQANRALNIAEAGLNGAVAALKASPASTTSLSPASGTVDNGTWSYTATREQDAGNPNLYYWTVTSTGTSPNGMVTRIVSTKVSQTITPTSTSTTVTTPTSNAYLYGFFLGDPASDCTTGSGGNTFTGNGDIRVDVYARGSLCLQGNGSILQPTGTQGTLNVYVGRKLKLPQNNATVGTSAAKIKSATVVGGCIRNTTAVTCSASASSHVYANTYSSTQNDITKPTIDTAWYTNAKPGPTTGCNNDPTNPANVSTYPSGWTADQFKNAVLDNDSTRNTSLGSVDFLRLVDYSNNSSFDCRYYASDGTLVGRLAWTWGNPGTLVIQGTVFIDGNLTFDGTDYAVYQGRGNIYFNGSVNFAGQAKICATPISGDPCLGNYAPSQNLLELVAVNANNGSSGFSETGEETFEGVAFTNGAFTGAGNSTIHGAVIADTASEAGNGSVPTTIDPPPGAPGASSTTTTTTGGPDQVSWSGVPGSWQQLR